MEPNEQERVARAREQWDAMEQSGGGRRKRWKPIQSELAVENGPVKLDLTIRPAAEPGEYLGTDPQRPPSGSSQQIRATVRFRF